MKSPPEHGVAPAPPNERERLEALHALRILDTRAEKAYDDLALIASQVCGTPISLISLVDEGREWFKSRVGLDMPEIPRHLAFCAHAILKPYEVMVVSDAAEDERFKNNPLVTEAPGIRFYAAVPLTTKNGHALGTLCVIDRVPRKLERAELRALSALGRQVVRQLEFRVAFGQLDEYRSKLELLNRDLKRRSLTDDLTGLWNRAAFSRRLDEEAARARRNDEPLGLLFIDADDFKAYNDTYGHQAGDEALSQIAELITATARENDFEARYGGEEFAVMLFNANKETCVVVAERIRVAVQSAEWPLRKVTISVGVSSRQGPSVDGDALVAAADACLYLAKAQGRNRVVAE